ncbi:MAG: hypothetical protein RR502_08150, partial [Oscillospiraceae bacterium]
MPTSKLAKLTYYDPRVETRLQVFADTVIYAQDGKQQILCAVRFGGYPEMVRAMSDAIYGGATLEMELGEVEMHLTSLVKRYRRQLSHNGVYAEATLMSLDDERTAKVGGEEENENQTQMENAERSSYIFCPEHDRDRLFEGVDRKTAVPLIPAFRDYVLDELERRGILRKLTVLSAKEKLDAWILKCRDDDADVISVVEDGMASGKISIPGATQGADGFEQIGSVTGYLNAFGVTVAQRIRTQFQPLFDPASEPLSSEILAIHENIRRCAGYPLYDAQLAVAESVKCQLTHNKVGLIVAECGSGKTKIGATALAAVAALKGNQRMCGRLKTFNVVLSPSHVTKKWVRELEETLPNTMAMVVHNPTELDRLYALYEEGECSAYAIISKETARDGYMKMPAVRWNVRKQAFLCPDCMQPIKMEISDDGNHYMVNADQFFFQNEHSKNHKCPRCGTPLWSALSPGKQTLWIKIGGYGWVLRNKAEQHLEKAKNEAVRDKLEQIISVPDGYYPTLGACRRYPISTYLKHKYRGRVDGCIADELHQYAQNSGQGDAMGEVFNVSRKFIGMTATLINGYSSGIFHLLYRLVPYLMQKDGKEHDKPRDFDSEYGVVETTYEVKDADYNANRRTTKTKKQTRQLPGVSPLVYSRF